MIIIIEFSHLGSLNGSFLCCIFPFASTRLTVASPLSAFFRSFGTGCHLDTSFDQKWKPPFTKFYQVHEEKCLWWRYTHRVERTVLMVFKMFS